MCTLIAVHRHLPGTPLLVVANRDEYFARPAEGPALRETAVGPVLAPLDLEARGTWLGLNQDGVFAALTNLRPADPERGPDRSRRSRGDIPFKALEAKTAAEAARSLGWLEEERYNPFQCFVADAEHAYLIVYQDRPSVRRLNPGVHVVGNVEAGLETAHKVRRIQEQAEQAVAQRRVPVLDALAGLCRDHSFSESAGENGSSLDDVCVHAGEAYGTRSSILIELSEDADECRLLYSEGAPCRAPYEDRTALLHELRRKPAE